MKPLYAVITSVVLSLGGLACANEPSIDGDVLGCGAQLTRIDHEVWVLSNGKLQGTGESCDDQHESSDAVVYGPKYQCVELASRYFMQRFGLDQPFDADAIDLCRKAAYGELANHVTVEPNLGKRTARAYVPVHGDLMVFSTPPYGHVGVVGTVNGDLVDIYEQNGAPSGHATRVLGTQECFIHANANANDDVPTSKAP